MNAVRGSLLRVSLVAGGMSFVAVLVLGGLIGGLIGEHTGSAKPVPVPPVSTTQSPTDAEPTIDASAPEDSGTQDTTTTSTTPSPSGSMARKQPADSVGAQITLTVRIRAQDSNGERIRLDDANGFDVTVTQGAPIGSTDTLKKVTPTGDVEVTVQAPERQPTQVCVTVTRPNWHLLTGGLNSEWIAQPDLGGCQMVTEPNGRTIDAVVVRS